MANDIEYGTDDQRRLRLAALSRWQSMAGVCAALGLGLDGDGPGSGPASHSESGFDTDFAAGRSQTVHSAPVIERRVLSLR